MEAAAKQVKLLSQRILPDRPHHLSFSPDSRCKANLDAQAPEEQIHRRLQYMTFISDCDRGVLLTRPYYDMREEPPTPNAKETPAPSRSDKKPAMKMSLSDYKNKVKQQSQSPLPAPGPRPKKPEESTPRSTQDRKDDSQQSETRKKDISLPPKESRVPASRDPLFNDRPSSLPPKPPPTRGPSPSPGGRKRGSDEDDTPRPAKRSKVDINGALDDKSRGQKDNIPSRGGADGPRKKDSPAAAGSIHDRADGRAGMSASSSTINGRSMLKAAMNSTHNGSPNARSRAGSLNGSRAESSGSSKSTPVKAPPSGTKATVPPLLSPLHISFDGPDTPKKAGKVPRKEEQPDSRGFTAKNKSERAAATKKERSPLMIPSLLSPTLPPTVEEELLRRKKTSKAAGSKSPEHPKNLKKPQVVSKDAEPPKKERLIATLRYPKQLSNRVQRLLALPGKNEKSGAAEQQQPRQTSKKRSLQSSGPPEISGEALNISLVGAKRPRKAEAVTAAAKSAPAPSTPSRPPSAMGHVNTPGESGPGSSSQPTQSLSGSQAPSSGSRLRQRGERYRTLGTKLKHARDDIVKRFPANQLPDTEHRLAVLTGIEATLSYMVGFRSFFEVRHAERKQPDAGVWRTLVPFVLELQRQARKLPFVYALTLVLHDLILQETLTCLYFSDLRVQGVVGELQQAGTAQFGLRNKLLRAYRQAEEAGLKLPVLNAGVSFDEGICKALEAMTAWAENEGLEWRATLSADDVLAGN